MTLQGTKGTELDPRAEEKVWIKYGGAVRKLIAKEFYVMPVKESAGAPFRIVV